MKQYQNKQHFSHEHILKPLELDPGEEINCAACEELISNPFYGCIECKFFLHPICSDAPRSMAHPSHPTHPLTLHQSPTYPGRSYTCDACGSNGKGFSFSCAHCEFDLHVLCAALGPTLLFEKEHPHEFKLVCEPDRTNKLICYICNVGDQRYWLYYCSVCMVGAHVNCLSSKHEDEGKITTDDDDNSKTEKPLPVKGTSTSSPSASGVRRVEAAPPPGNAAATRPPPPGNAAATRPPPPGNAAATRPPPPSNAAAARPPPPGNAAATRPPPPGNAAATRPPPPGNAAATRQQQGGNAAATRQQQGGNAAAAEAQRRARLEEQLAQRLILEALVGPPYTRGYYFY